MPQNAYLESILDAKIGFDTEENEPPNVWGELIYSLFIIHFRHLPGDLVGGGEARGGGVAPRRAQGGRDVPTTSLVKQMVGDFAKYSEHDALFDAEGMCHEIMAGKDKGHETKKIYVSTWQSIYKMQKGYFQQFGMVIGDEAHGCKAKSLTSSLTKCTEAG